MSTLQDFERRLEGAVEGFFARAFRSGLQPVELAKALQRYAEDHRQVTERSVVCPNVYRFRLHEDDLERFRGYGESLPRELAEVVVRTAQERNWELAGPVVVRLVHDPEIDYGRYRLNGRVEIVDGALTADGAATSGGLTGVASEARPVATLGVRLLAGDGGFLPLEGDRAAVGRLPSCEVVIDDPTVSREHAVFVRRGDDWWVLDLGSTNGTRVNGRQAAEQRIAAGDRVEFGEASVEIVEL